MNVPPFAIGRLKWDNWLVWKARVQGFPIIDVTEAVTIVHQNHEYAPDKIRKLDAKDVTSRNQAQLMGSKLWFDGSWNELGPEAQRNIAMVPEEQNLNILAATWKIDRKGRLGRRCLTLKPAYWYYQLKSVVPIFWPIFGRIFGWIISIAKVLFHFRTTKKL